MIKVEISFGQPEFDQITIPQADSRDVHLWDKAQDRLLALMKLESGWDGFGSAQIRPEMIRSALRLACELQERGESAPQDVYPLSDGNIILEWQLPSGVIRRIEVEGMGIGQLMTTFANAPAQFEDIIWPTTSVPAWELVAVGQSVTEWPVECGFGHPYTVTNNPSVSDPESFPLAA